MFKDAHDDRRTGPLYNLHKLRISRQTYTTHVITAASYSEPEIAQSLKEAWAAFGRNEYSRACHTFQACQMDAPRDSASHMLACFGLAHAAAAMGQFDRIGEALSDLLTQAGRCEDTKRLMGAAWTPFNSHARAIDPVQAGLVALAQNNDGWVSRLRVLADIYEGAADFSGAIAVFRALGSVSPRDAATVTRVGRLWMLADNMTEAVPFFREALAIDPTHVIAADLLATAMWSQGDIAGTSAALEHRIAVTPDPQEQAALRFKAATILPPVARDDAQIDELRARQLSMFLNEPVVQFSDPWRQGLGLNVYSDYHARSERQMREAAAAYFRARTPSLGENLASSRRHGKIIRVGMVSRYFNQHTVGYLVEGLVRNMDRTRFELILFRTPNARSDSATESLGRAVPLKTLPNDLDAARRMIAEAELDILHYPEIGTDAFTYFLAFARLAPLQTVGWGHPVTTGLPAIDLFLSADAMEPPAAEAHYSERLVRLKELSIHATRPERPRDLASRDELGLSARRPAYVCAQNLYKLHHAFDDILRLVLEKDRDGLVYLISHSPLVDGLLGNRLRRAIGDDFSRVIFLSRLSAEDFLRILGAADVLLDVPQWSGGKTSLEGFAMGTPIVHMPGAFMRGRHTLAFLRKMDVNTVADSPSSYADIAARLVHDDAFRRSVRGEIAERSAQLFGDIASVREIENTWAEALATRNAR